MTSAPAPTSVPDRPQPSWGRLLWGVAFVGAGLAWLLDASGAVDVTFPRLIAVALIGVGIVTPFVPQRERGGVIGLGVVLVVLAIVAIVVGPVARLSVVGSGVGDLTIAPASARQVQPVYEHGVGDVVVDLGGIAFPAGTTATSIRLGAGDLRVQVPADATVQVDAEAGMGEVVVDTQERTGLAPSFGGELAGTSSERVLELEASVGMGRVEVTR